MKKVLIILLVFNLLSKLVSAQDSLKFENLSLNSSPAYNVLGVDPQNIQRPNSPSDFIAGVKSAVVNGKLSPNFALETTPYYWSHRNDDTGKRISLYNYFKNPNKVYDNVMQSFTLSLATSESDTTVFGKLMPGTGYGLGLRFNLFNGHINKKVINQLVQLSAFKEINNLYESILGQLQVGNKVNVKDFIEKWEKDKSKSISSEFINNAVEGVQKKLNKKDLTPSDRNLVEGLIRERDKENSSQLADLNKTVCPLTKEGFMLEIAAANGGVVQNNEWKDAANAKTAIWITPSWRFNSRKDPAVVDYFDVMAVARLTFNSKQVDTSNYVDGGLKLQYTHNKLSLSGEGIIRYLTNKPDNQRKNTTWRYDFSLSYKVNDFVTFQATFGANFDGNSVHYSDPNKMFAVGGFNFGFGNLFK